MKNILVTILVIFLILVMTACENNTVTSQQSQNGSSTSTTSDQKEDSESSAEASSSKQEDPEVSSQNSEETTSSEQKDPDMIVGTLYAIFSESETREFDFGYEDGTLTPEKIANSLTDLTGLNFHISVTNVNTEWNSITIEWEDDSAFVTGSPPEPQKDDFHFFDSDSMRWFMLNSLCRTIRENYGEVDVYYTINNGMDINDIGLGVDFNPSIPYNQVEDSRVLG